MVGGILCALLARTLPPYSGNKISSFNDLQGRRRRKIFITKEFAAESRQQRTYGRFAPKDPVRNEFSQCLKRD
jgi:hypothetical protein